MEPDKFHDSFLVLVRTCSRASQSVVGRLFCVDPHNLAGAALGARRTGIRAICYHTHWDAASAHIAAAASHGPVN